MDRKRLADVVRQIDRARTDRGWSWGTLADEAGVNKDTMTRVKFIADHADDDTPLPGLREGTITKIRAALEIRPLAELIADEVDDPRIKSLVHQFRIFLTRVPEDRIDEVGGDLFDTYMALTRKYEIGSVPASSERTRLA